MATVAGVGSGVPFTQKFISAFLSQFSNASAAYSLRQLSSSPTDVVRVKRNSDIKEQDFTATEVKGTELLDFVVPTDVQALYGATVFLDGVNQYVNFGTSVFTLNSQPLRFKFDFIDIGASDFDYLVARGLNQGGYGISISDTNTIVITGKQAGSGALYRTFTSDLTVNPYEKYELDVTIGTACSSASGTLNGQTITWTDSGETGVYGDSTSNNDFLIGARISSSNPWRGVISNFEGYENSALTHAYAGDSTTTWVDLVGSVDGTVNGSPALFTGQGFNGYVSTWYDQRVPTSKDRMYFGGESAEQYVVLDSTITVDSDDFIEFEVIFDTINSIHKVYLFAESGVNRIFTTSDNLWVEFSVVETQFSYTSSLQVGTKYKIKIERNGTQTSLYVDGVLQETRSTGSNEFRFDIIGGKNFPSSCLYLHGTIFNININNEHYYKGHGNLDSDWTDQIGSNYGTVVGSPARISSVNYTTISNDAIQETTDNQPVIVEDGQLITENGKPAMKFDGVAHYLITNKVFDDTASVFIVTNITSASNVVMFGAYDASEDYRFYFGVSLAGEYGWGHGSSSYNDIESSVAYGVQGLSSGFFKSTDFTGYINGGNETTNTPTILGIPTNNDFAYIGASNQGEEIPTLFAEGKIQELIVYDADQLSNREAIEKNINSHYKIY